MTFYPDAFSMWGKDVMKFARTMVRADFISSFPCMRARFTRMHVMHYLLEYQAQVVNLRAPTIFRKPNIMCEKWYE